MALIIMDGGTLIISADLSNAAVTSAGILNKRRISVLGSGIRAFNGSIENRGTFFKL